MTRSSRRLDCVTDCKSSIAELHRGREIANNAFAPGCARGMLYIAHTKSKEKPTLSLF